MTVILAALGPAAVEAALDGRPGSAAARGEARPIAAAVPSFQEIYEEQFDFVWRSVRRLGVHPASVDDAIQDVFLVVHRRLADFEGRSSVKTWVFGIAVRVARDHQRAVRRRGGHEELHPGIPDGAPGPAESLVRSEALRELDRILATLDEDKRAVFVLADIEQLAAPEISAALGVNVNTVYSRLRAARRAVEAALLPSKEAPR